MSHSGMASGEDGDRAMPLVAPEGDTGHITRLGGSVLHV